MSETVKKEILEWIKVIVVAGILAMVITHFIKPTIVRGESMYPTLKPNDYLIMNRVAYHNNPIHYLDVIVFESELPLEGEDSVAKKDLVKRYFDWTLYYSCRFVGSKFTVAPLVSV